MKAIITIGAPASGKTTWSKEWKAKSKNRRVVERDVARMELFQLNNYSDYKFSKKNEQDVTEYCKGTLEACRLFELDVCISDTNLNPVHREELVTFLEELGYEVEFKTFDVDFFELVKRDEKRTEKTVGRQVIYKFYQQMQEYLGKEKYVPDYNLPPAYIFDIDGTIADMTGVRGPFEWDKVSLDKPINSVLGVLDSLRVMGHKIVLLSGRDGSSRKLTEEWLDKHEVEYDDLFMREAGDCRKDSIIKKELFDNNVVTKYYVYGVFDDRPQVCLMWQDLGIPLFKVGDMVKEF